MGAVHRGPPRRDRHHLRFARVPCSDGCETSDRVLVGRAHGLRDARHRNDDPIGINAAIIGMVAHGFITASCSSSPGRWRIAITPATWAASVATWCSCQRWVSCSDSPRWHPSDFPLAGFWGEFMALMASFNPLEAIGATSLFRVFMVIGAVGTVLTAGYMLYMLRNVNFGEPAEEWADHEFEDVDSYEWLAWAPLVIGTIAIGIYPEDRLRSNERRRRHARREGIRRLTCLISTTTRFYPRSSSP